MVLRIYMHYKTQKVTTEQVLSNGLQNKESLKKDFKQLFKKTFQTFQYHTTTIKRHSFYSKIVSLA